MERKDNNGVIRLLIIAVAALLFALVLSNNAGAQTNSCTEQLNLSGRGLWYGKINFSYSNTGSLNKNSDINLSDSECPYDSCAWKFKESGDISKIHLWVYPGSAPYPHFDDWGGGDNHITYFHCGDRPTCKISDSWSENIHGTLNINDNYTYEENLSTYSLIDRIATNAPINDTDSLSLSFNSSTCMYFFNLILFSGYINIGSRYRPIDTNLHLSGSASFPQIGQGIFETGKDDYYASTIESRTKFATVNWEFKPGEGIDVSHHQGDIDWVKVEKQGIDFAYIKATEGKTVTDEKFESNMKNAQFAIPLVGAYHFAHPLINSPEDEAHHFVNISREYLMLGYLRPALDIEDYEVRDRNTNQLIHGEYPCKGKIYNNATGETTKKIKGADNLSDWITRWVDVVDDEIGLDINPQLTVYMNKDYASNSQCLNPSVTNYGLWIANYKAPPVPPPKTGIWNDWDFWQYSQTGSLDGIGTGICNPATRENCVDLDKLKDTHEGNLMGGNVILDFTPEFLPTAQPTSTVAATSSLTPSPSVNPTQKSGGFEIILAVTVLLVVYLFGRKRKISKQSQIQR